MTLRRMWWSTVVGVCAFLPGTSQSLAQVAQVNIETQVKAGYLGNFGIYVDYAKDPVGEKENFHIGVLGSDTVVPLLKTIADKKTINDRKIVVHHYKSVDDVKPCHILFIPEHPAKADGEAADKRLAAALQKVKGASVLFVTESEGLATKGAMLNFFIDGNNVRFEVNMEAAKKAGLQLRSQLLQIGKIVQQPGK